MEELRQIHYFAITAIFLVIMVLTSIVGMVQNTAADRFR